MPVSSEQPTNGILPASSTAPQVFDYGHQSSASFSRQNSCPTTTNGSKSSSSVSSSKTKYSSYNKTPPPSGSSLYPASNSVAQNGPTSFNFRDKSPSGWSQKLSGNNSVSGNNKYPSSSRKHFKKQFSHKY